MSVFSNVPDSQKSAVRKKSKLFNLEDGILYYIDKKTKVKQQDIRDTATRRQVF